MTKRKKSKEQSPEPNPALRRLDALVGEWEIQASLGEQPLGRARTTFEWLEGASLIQHAEEEPASSSAPPEWMENSPMPVTTIIGLDNSSETFTQAGDIQTVLSLITDDVVFMAPGNEPFGKEAFATTAEKMKDALQVFEGTSEIREIQVLADWAYLRAYVEITMTTPDSPTPVHRSGYTLTILRKESDGRWRIARDANLLSTKENLP